MSESALTKLSLLESYKFKVEFDMQDVPAIVVDEMKPTGEGSGPNPSRLLSTAVGHCLSSSLLYCLGKAKIKVKNLNTTVTADIRRNEEGYRRISGLNVQIHLEVDEADRIRLPRCLTIFENYCMVTQSIRNGIPVKVTVD